ncbi:MAG: hypothetical protein KTR21_06610, partial [Rhodobacteraceae bacterium]|nr:hypothetical protein [Paracoccaceae bacterium]
RFPVRRLAAIKPSGKNFALADTYPQLSFVAGLTTEDGGRYSNGAQQHTVIICKMGAVGAPPIDPRRTERDHF